LLASQPRKAEQFINQSAHALCFALNHTQDTFPIGIEFVLAVLLKDPRITADAPQRRAPAFGYHDGGEIGATRMSGFADYERYDALGLAELVRRRQVSPGELLDAAIARVEARNRAVNAVTMELYDYGRRAIADGLPDGPFTGVPFLMKDLTASIAGIRMTRSSRFFADAPAPTADSEHVRRLKRAGLVIFGRTNTCELGLSLTCEPQLHGPTRNPWDPTRISGGSSGGAAAAVGARILPMAHTWQGSKLKVQDLFQLCGNRFNNEEICTIKLALCIGANVWSKLRTRVSAHQQLHQGLPRVAARSEAEWTHEPWTEQGENCTGRVTPSL